MLKRLIFFTPSLIPAIYGTVIGQLQLGQGGFDRMIMVVLAYTASLVIICLAATVKKWIIPQNALAVFVIQVVLSMIAVIWLSNSFPPERY